MNKSGIKETTKSYLVNVDVLFDREQYYTGSGAGTIYRIPKSWGNPLDKHNEMYTNIEVWLEFDRKIPVYRKGYIV